MTYALALALGLLYAGLVVNLCFTNKLIHAQLGVISLFSLGYYIMPIFFRDLAALNTFTEPEILDSQLIHGVFFAALLAGAILADRWFAGMRGLSLSNLDDFLSLHLTKICVFCFAIFIVYYLTQNITSYVADDFDGFFENHNPWFGFIGAIGSLAQAFLAVALADLLKLSARGRAITVAVMLGICLLLLARLGNRSTLLYPLIALMASLFATGQRKNAVSMAGFAVVALLLFSPFAVYFREQRGVSDFASIMDSFSYGDNMFFTLLKSVMERGDLHFNTIALKPIIDREPAPGFIYYYSALVSPIPKILLASKPYALSVDGTMNGEISVWAWHMLADNSVGSLTAFGGLVAYQEGGWLWVPANGFATGVLFAFLARGLGGGGLTARLFYAQVFVLMSVQMVPPSFFQAVVLGLGIVSMLLAAVLLNVVLGLFRPRVPSFARPARLSSG